MPRLRRSRPARMPCTTCSSSSRVPSVAVFRRGGLRSSAGVRHACHRSRRTGCGPSSWRSGAGSVAGRCNGAGCISMEAPQKTTHPRTPDGSTVVAAGDETIQPRTSAELIVPAPWKTAASFVAAIRQGEAAALRALFTFYTPLLRDQARQMGVPATDGEHLVTTVLDDFVLRVLDAE